MCERGAFQVVAVAVDTYDGWPPLRGSEKAQAIAERLREWGAVHVRTAAPTMPENILDMLAEWTTDADAPASSFLYWTGHGTVSGSRHWLCTSKSGADPNPATAIESRQLVHYLLDDYYRRDSYGDPDSWTVVILDCCGAAVGATNIMHDLTRDPSERPKRLVLFPAVPDGGAYSDRFANALETVFRTLDANDWKIELGDLLGRIADQLGGEIEFTRPPASLALRRQRPEGGVVTGPLDAIAELQRLVDDLPPAVRSHFFEKAQGGESGELAWYFSGRETELERVAGWLEAAPSGLLAITGRPGSGKSAILGQLVTLADPELVAALERAELIAPPRPESMPPPGIFDATLHVKGVSDFDFRRRLAEAFGVAVEDGIEALFASWEGARRTILVDALDEADEPLVIAHALRRFAAQSGVRVLVGTRASSFDAVDAPASGARELLDALAPSETLVVERDATAVAEYVRRRLTAPESPYQRDPGVVRVLAERIAAREQPFLFARLAASELLARPAFEPSSPALAALLDGEHWQIFAGAVERLAVLSPMTRPLLDALAYALGRGLPRAGGVWATVAATLHPGVMISESDIDLVLERAAPYITLDGDAGQSTYRLAHERFAEYLRSLR